MTIKEESRLKFGFSEECTVIKFDETSFYRKFFNKLPEAKGVDFIVTDKTKNILKISISGGTND